MSYQIYTKAGRARLKPRRNPYYLPLAIQGGFIGYRTTSGTWIARLRVDVFEGYDHLNLPMDVWVTGVLDFLEGKAW